MPPTELPFRATTEQVCLWLAHQTDSAWTLARLIEYGVTPYVWLDYDAERAELFGADVVANGGYAAPIFFEGDTQRLAAGSADVLITMTKDADNIVIKLPPPGLRRALSELRFLKKDLQRVLKQFQKNAAAALADQVAEQSGKDPATSTARESQTGIPRDQVLAAFARLVKFDLEQALSAGVGIFGDDGARIKNKSGKTKNRLWNPVHLALGLHDVHRVPMPHLKRTFLSQECLQEWRPLWQQSLDLLGE
jgi:hypothetical protein